MPANRRAAQPIKSEHCTCLFNPHLDTAELAALDSRLSRATSLASIPSFPIPIDSSISQKTQNGFGTTLTRKRWSTITTNGEETWKGARNKTACLKMAERNREMSKEEREKVKRKRETLYKNFDDCFQKPMEVVA